MDIELSEEYVIKEKNNIKEYVDKINAFINKYSNFKPYFSINPYLENSLMNSNKDLKELDIRLLDTRYFSRDNLTTNTYTFYVVYSDTLKRKLIIFSERWGYGHWHIFGKELNRVSLSMAKRLYNKLVKDVIDQSILIREQKILRDEILKGTSFKYFFNPRKTICYVIKNCDINWETRNVSFNMLHLNYNSNLSCQMNNSKRYVTDFTHFYKDYIQNNMLTNNFNEDILPMFSAKFEEKINSLRERNSQLISSFNLS